MEEILIDMLEILVGYDADGNKVLQVCKDGAIVQTVPMEQDIEEEEDVWYPLLQ